MSSPPLTDRSTTVFKTPTSSRCGFLGGGAAPIAEGGKTTISPTTPAAHTPRRPIAGGIRTPRSGRTPGGGDRFIPSRAGADLQFSAYRIRSARRRRKDGCSDRAENGGLARTPTAADPDSAHRREKLFALRGRSSDGRVLHIKQVSASGGNRKGELLSTAETSSYSVTSPRGCCQIPTGGTTVSRRLAPPLRGDLCGGIQRLQIRSWMLPT